MKKWIEETDIRKIYLLSIGGGLGILLAGGFVGRSLFNQSPPVLFSIVLYSLVGFGYIFPGFAQIIKRESPYGMKGIIQGRRAVISGRIWVVLFSSILLLMILDLLLIF